MSRLIPFAVTIALAMCASAGVHAQPSDSHNYSKSEIKQMIRDAQSVQQFQALAAYFRSRQQAMKQQAHSEIVEWERRSQITAGLYEKYPRPVDSSRNRYEYFNYEAKQMALQARHFESLSAKSQ